MIYGESAALRWEYIFENVCKRPLSSIANFSTQHRTSHGIDLGNGLLLGILCSRDLALEFGAESVSLSDLEDFDHEVLVQATPVGWENDEMPVDPDHLRKGRIVIDSIYKDTALLKKARERGCRAINGEKWFTVQAEAQFRWWKEMLQVEG